MGDELDAHLFKVDRVFKHPVDLLQHRGHIPAQHRVGHREQRIGHRQPRALPHVLEGDFLRAGRAAVLLPGAGVGAADIEQRERVAHPALGKAGDEVGSLRLNLDALLLTDPPHPRGDDRGADAPKVKPLAAGEDGGGNLVHLGGGEDEDDVLGRLLHDFEQGVERPDAEHVGLVDDVDAVVDLGGGEVCLLAQLADVVDAVVAGRVDLGDVEHRAVVDALADFAHPAGIAVLLVWAVDRLGDDLGAGGLAGAARAGEQVGVADAAAGDLLL